MHIEINHSMNGLLCLAALSAGLAIGLTYDINIANISLKQFIEEVYIFFKKK